MSIPKIFHPILPNDVTLTNFKVHKTFNLNGINITDTSSGYFILDAVHTNLITPVGSQKANNDPTNSFDGSFQHLIWNSIDAQYYRYPYDYNNTKEHANPRYTFKFLNTSASILSIPYMDYGEAIKYGSVEISQSNFNISDDKNGNLYDVSIDTSSFTSTQNLVAYWGLNDEFRKFKYTEGYLSNSTLKYNSYTFSPPQPSYCKNINITLGVPINNVASGLACEFTTNNSYIFTEHRDEYNFTDDEDFTWSFWLKCNESSSQFNIINKNYLIENMEYGENNKYINDLQTKMLHVSRSFVTKPINVFPYNFDILSGSVIFKRSDGINTVTLSGSNICNNDWHHIGVVKTGSKFQIYEDSILLNESTKILNGAFNKHSLFFGNFNGSLDEIRIYDKAMTGNQIASLANNTNQSMYQTAVCGNVFYRTGNIVISGFDTKYLNAFKGQDWFVKYKATHTIFQREILTRIKKTEFNVSQNPTTIQSYKSDLIIPSMVSGSLLPYFNMIGFYDDEKNLLAVAKTNQPIQLRDDTDINLITRFDV